MTGLRPFRVPDLASRCPACLGKRRGTVIPGCLPSRFLSGTAIMAAGARRPGRPARMPGLNIGWSPSAGPAWFDYDTAGLNALLRGRGARPAVTAGDGFVMP